LCMVTLCSYFAFSIIVELFTKLMASPNANPVYLLTSSQPFDMCNAMGTHLTLNSDLRPWNLSDRLFNYNLAKPNNSRNCSAVV